MTHAHLHSQKVLHHRSVPFFSQPRIRPTTNRLPPHLRHLLLLLLHRILPLSLVLSIRFSKQDPGSYLAWARSDVFSFVLYYLQERSEPTHMATKVWAQELISAAIDLGGSFYLPYQIYATATQFHAAYPRAREFFALKKILDPHYRFRNALWDTYYQPCLMESTHV